MRDYAKQCVEHYKKAAKRDKIRQYSNPYLPDGALTEADYEVCGQLAGQPKFLSEGLMACLALTSRFIQGNL